MQKIAVTGCASRFAKVLLPLLDNDPNITQIVGIDLVPPTSIYHKLSFHKQDIRDPGIRETLAGCDTLVHLAFIVGRPYSMPLAEAASINLGGTWNTCKAAAEAGVRKLVVSSSIAAYSTLPDNPEPVFLRYPSARPLYQFLLQPAQTRQRNLVGWATVRFSSTHHLARSTMYCYRALPIGSNILHSSQQNSLLKSRSAQDSPATGSRG